MQNEQLKRRHLLILIASLSLLFAAIALVAKGYLKLKRNESQDQQTRSEAPTGKNQFLNALPTSYTECKATDTSLISEFVCTALIPDSSDIFQECVSSNGGVINMADFTGEDTCPISYYNFSFNNWPKNYQECLTAFEDHGNPAYCAEIIPRDDTYVKDLERALVIKDKCESLGGKLIDGGRSCLIGFEKQTK